MLETYDAKWAEKWDRAKAEYDQIQAIFNEYGSKTPRKLRKPALA